MRLGCIGDWFHPYITMDPSYDAAEIGVLRNLVERGYVYRGLRPVHWCFADRTALAEAEVEYRDHVSPSIYVAFAFNAHLRDAAALAASASDRAELAAAHKAGKLFAVIWTTTPWTLPANLGISLNPTFDYVALKAGDRYYVVAARLAEAVAKECSLTVEKSIALDREALKSLDGQDIFRHPFVARDVKLMYGDHVTADAGTGLVHTAPGHGYEDFVVGSQYGLKPFTPVDTAGKFTADGGEWAGQNVFKANDSIVEKLRADRRVAPFAQVLAQLSALLALQESADFPRRRAMVHAYRSRRTAPARDRGNRRRAMDSAVVARPYPQHDRDAARLVSLAPARVGRADSGT